MEKCWAVWLPLEPVVDGYLTVLHAPSASSRGKTKSELVDAFIFFSK
jgi:hypothetical protein